MPCGRLVNKAREGAIIHMKVLIATEGSDFSNAAIRKFCEMFSGKRELFVKVVSVVQPALVPSAPFEIASSFVDQIDKFAVTHARSVVDRAAEEIERALPFAEEVRKDVITGTPEQSIIEEAEAWKADLIVTGSHGHGFLKRAWLGSVSNAVVHRAPCSVLIIRKDGTPRY